MAAGKREVGVLWEQMTAILGLQASQNVFSFPLKECRLQESGEGGGLQQKEAGYRKTVGRPSESPWLDLHRAGLGAWGPH